MSRYDRTIKLFGQNTFEQFQNTKLILLGVGGVGSFALDALYNTGITNITLVDFDSYEESNLNRQLGSVGNIGRIKVEALKEKYPLVTAIHAKITPQWIDEHDFETSEPPRDCRRLNILREYDNENTKLHS